MEEWKTYKYVRVVPGMGVLSEKQEYSLHIQI